MPQLTISNKTYKVTKGNIENVFKSATKERIAETRKWYSDAQKFTENLSLKFNHELSKFPHWSQYAIILNVTVINIIHF